MPTIDRVRGNRLFFYSNEGSEPPHVHVMRGQHTAKVWLDPAAVAASSGYAAHEVRRLERMVRGNRARYLEAWNEFFAD